MSSLALTHVLVGTVGGALLGSTSTALSYRLPRSLAVVWDRSICPHCGTQLRAIENVPVVSYLLLHGRCGHCHTKISSRYVITEISFAVVYAMVTLRHGLTLVTLELWITLFVALTSAVIDLEWKKIPNRLTYPASVLLLLLAVVQSFRSGVHVLIGTVVVGVAVFAAFYCVNRVTHGGFGLGDAKLAAVVAMALISFGLVVVLDFLMVAFVLGGGVGVGLLLSGRKGRKETMPFGPFLAAGFVLVALVV